MGRAPLRSAGLSLLAGVALAGAAAGGYALGAASSKPPARAAETPRAAQSGDTVEVLRRIELRLARLEARGADVLAAAGRAAPGTHGRAGTVAPEIAETGEAPADAVTPEVAETGGVRGDPGTSDSGEIDGAPAAVSDPDVLLTSQRLLDDVLATRSMSEAHKAALRETLPKLSMTDRLAAMSALGDAVNRGELQFDAREVF